ncbi:MAG: hypothetical protein ACI9U2_000589 [Bradymonadia bacterium]
MRWPDRLVHRCALFVAATTALLACSDAPLIIHEASVAERASDPTGPYAVSVWAGGRGLSAAVRVTDRGAAVLQGPCSGPARVGPWRGVDFGIDSDCWQIGLRADGGGYFSGALQGPPFAVGAIVHWRIVVEDDSGDRALWPAEAAGVLEIAPAADAPQLVTLGPNHGPQAGGTQVGLRGEGFGPGLTVRFGDRDGLDVEVVSEHFALVTTPSAGAPGRVDVIVFDHGRAARLVEAFDFQAPPRIDRLAPAEGPTVSSTRVVIDGANFVEGAAVAFGDVDSSETRVLSPTRLTAVAPPHEPATVDVQVTNPDLQSGIAPGAFTWWPPPQIDALEPVEGPDLGGTRFRLTGRDFRAPAAVWFGGREATRVEVDADGAIAIGATPLSPEGLFEVRLYNPDGQFSIAPAMFLFRGPPFVDEAVPPVLSRCGGGETTLIGRNFDPQMQVRIDGVPAEVLEVSEDGTRARVRAGPGAPGPVLIEITNPDGRAYRADDLLVYGVQPVVRDVEPVEVPVWGGTLVRITGSDFDRDANVTFDGIDAELTRVVEAGCEALIEAIVPPNDAGPADVRVTNPDGIEGLRREGIIYVEPALDPPTGLTPGYANLRLTGIDLRAGLSVQFGQRAPRRLTQDDTTLWRIVTPAGERGVVDVTIRNADGRGVTLPGAFRYRAFDDETDGRFEAIGDCNDVSVLDVDGDGDLDMVTANGAVGGLGRVDQPAGVHINDGTGRFEARALSPQGNGMNARLGDADGDGDADLIVANLSSPRNFFFENRGDGQFVHVPAHPARGPSYDADFIDADGDGDLDLLTLQTGNPDSNLMDGPDRLYSNDGAGNFVEVPGAVAFDLRDVHDHDFGHGDLNGDGLPDLVIVVDNISDQFAGASNRLLLNAGGRFVQAPSPFDDFPGDWLHAELADLDADGDLDVLLPQDYIEGISRPGTPPIAVFINDGQANFEEQNRRIQGMPLLPAFESVVADVDGDGDVDIVVAVFGLLFADGDIEPFRSVLLLNDGEAQFFEASAAFSVGLDLATTDFGVADLDGDGVADLFECAARGESRLWIQR